jgi:hypothetical protein
MSFMDMKETLEMMFEAPKEQPFLIPPKLWEIGLREGYIRLEGEKFFVGRHWVMRSEYVGVG